MNKADGNTPQRTIRVEDDLWRDARVVANERDENVSDIIRRALKRYVKRYEDALEADAQPRTATFVRRLNDDEIEFHSDVKDQTLWRVTPPVESWDSEEVYSYVVLSHNESGFSTGPETMIFPARANGEIVSYGELFTNGRGMTVEKALAYADFEIHAEGYVKAKYPKRADLEKAVIKSVTDANDAPINVGDKVHHYRDEYMGEGTVEKLYVQDGFPWVYVTFPNEAHNAGYHPDALVHVPE